MLPQGQKNGTYEERWQVARPPLPLVTVATYVKRPVQLYNAVGTLTKQFKLTLPLKIRVRLMNINRNFRFFSTGDFVSELIKLMFAKMLRKPSSKSPAFKLWLACQC